MQELTGHPAAFLGGLASGLLRLNLADEPVQGWLRQQGVTPGTDGTGFPGGSQNGNGPQTISID